jgi:hypothetical protein
MPPPSPDAPASGETIESIASIGVTPATARFENPHPDAIAPASFPSR